jgi:hypothetical protein
VPAPEPGASPTGPPGLELPVSLAPHTAGAAAAPRLPAGLLLSRRLAGSGVSPGGLVPGRRRGCGGARGQPEHEQNSDGGNYRGRAANGHPPASYLTLGHGRTLALTTEPASVVVMVVVRQRVQRQARYKDRGEAGGHGNRRD